MKFKIVFILSLLYWIYLACTCQPVIVHDSIEYHRLGQLLLNEGWVEYFQTGPQREPLYPLMIAAAMNIGNKLSVEYITILYIIQMLFLFCTQYLTYRLLKKLNISSTISICILLYLAISPSIVNLYLSVYSEIVTYPFILGIAWIGAASWQSLKHASKLKITLLAAALGILFCGILASKAIYEYVLYAHIFIFCIPLLISLIKKDKKLLINSALFLLIFQFMSLGPMSLYKSINEKYNGYSVITGGRGAHHIHASARRRTDPLDAPKVKALLARVVSDHFCESYLKLTNCQYWHIQKFDNTELVEYLKPYPEDRHESETTKLGIKIALSNPIQFTLLSGSEAVRLFIWETMNIGFVTYPQWLTHIFRNTTLEYILSIGWAVISLIGFFYVVCSIIRQRKELFNFDLTIQNSTVLLLFLISIITTHVGLYSIVMTVTRFSSPIVPLLLICVAYFLNKKFT